ncbi:MAG: hypothetical protein HW421_2359 [Ignavibacteria bacterium]|nr:hypothetical protein [Ignavibacteria bacterium]
MKFIVDAQLPYALCEIFIFKGFDAIHTNDLPTKERTPDSEILQLSINQNRIVVTKDSDFLDSYNLKGNPEKLLLITTGNIKNNRLYELFENNFDTIIGMFKVYNLVEMSNDYIEGFE